MAAPARSLAHSLLSGAAQALPYLIDGLTTEGAPTKGHVGNNLFADNARILFINGVGSREHTCREKAEQISKVFDNCRVDYVYIPLTFPQAYEALQHSTSPDGSKLILETLKSYERDLRRDRHPVACEKAHRVLSKGERIICIVHSGGGATLDSIKRQIPPTILDLIDLVSFGSAKVFGSDEFRSVRNFVAENDLIPLATSVYSGDVKNLLDRATQIVPALQDENPIASHQFTSTTYQVALEQLHYDYTREMEPKP